AVPPRGLQRVQPREPVEPGQLVEQLELRTGYVDRDRSADRAAGAEVFVLARENSPSGVATSSTAWSSISVMQVPKLIRPPTEATPAEAVAAHGRPRALPDDFLRQASTRLGVMS